VLKRQVTAAMAREPQTLLKAISARHGTGDGDQDQGAEVLASLTALSQTDRTAPDFGINTGHPARC
jgi:hypothetical protein